MNDFLSKDDYEEPRCLLNMHPEVTPIPVGRMIEKLDSYLNQNDYDAAERHLKYWLTEADNCLAGTCHRCCIELFEHYILVYDNFVKNVI